MPLPGTTTPEPESPEVRLDEGDHRAVAVSRCQVDRVAAVRIAGPWFARARGIDEACALLQVGRVEQLPRRHPHVRGIADVLSQIGEGEPHCLDLQVQRLRRIDARLLQVKVPKHAQRHQGPDALAARPDLVQFVFTVADADREHPVRLMGREVRFSQQTARIARMFGDRGRPIHRDRSFRLWSAQCFPESRHGRGQLNRSPGSGARPFGANVSANPGCPLSSPTCSCHCRCTVGRNEVAIARVSDRRLEKVFERQRSESVPDGAPSRDSSGDRDATPADAVHRLFAGEARRFPG